MGTLYVIHSHHPCSPPTALPPKCAICPLTRQKHPFYHAPSLDPTPTQRRNQTTQGSPPDPPEDSTPQPIPIPLPSRRGDRPVALPCEATRLRHKLVHPPWAEKKPSPQHGSRAPFPDPRRWMVHRLCLRHLASLKMPMPIGASSTGAFPSTTLPSPRTPSSL